MHYVSLRIHQSWIAALLLVGNSCSDAPAERTSSGTARQAEAAQSTFNLALRDYSQALDEGLRLDERGMGRGPITHVSLFSEYRKFFYLPLSAEALLKPEFAGFLEAEVNVGKPVERELAQRCLEISRSRRKLRREREYRFTAPSEMGFALYHYDP